MTMLSYMNWQCKCGQRNTAQLWTHNEKHSCEDYENGNIPTDCDINFDEPCSKCNKYKLADDGKLNKSGFIFFDVIPA